MNNNIRKIVLTSLFIALGVILPQILHLFNLGMVISPMHFPVLICGLLLGGYYGFACGVITPILTGFIFSKPHLFPTGLSMAIELGVYGLVSGLFSTKIILFKKEKINVYFSLIIAMLIGRFTASLINTIMYLSGLSNNNLGEYLKILFVIGLPGIALQLLIIPPVVLFIKKHLHKDFV